MSEGIGEGLTRNDHSNVSDQLYAGYAEGRDLRALVNIVGREALSERDNTYLDFADRFEKEFIMLTFCFATTVLGKFFISFIWFSSTSLSSLFLVCF